MFMQTIGYDVRATDVSMLRQGICFVPFILLLPAVFGLWGVVLTQPFADGVSLLIAYLICRGILREMEVKVQADRGGGKI